MNILSKDILPLKTSQKFSSVLEPYAGKVASTVLRRECHCEVMFLSDYNEFYDCEVLVVIGTSGAVINTDRLLTSKIKFSILNNLEKSVFLNDTLYSKVLYKKASLAIDEIAKDIPNYLKIF